MRKPIALLSLIAFGCIWLSLQGNDITKINRNNKILVAYVEEERSSTPDPFNFSHLIYAFGRINNKFNGVTITNERKLKDLSGLKSINPDLQVILGIGSSNPSEFSEMTKDKTRRNNFINSCKQIIEKYGLDGIDLDWEFPGINKETNTNESENYALLVKELREALGKDKWISFYSNNSGKWIDFHKMLPYVDYVNVSGYNLSVPKSDTKLNHQSPLYSSKKYGKWCIEKSIARHNQLGVPYEKILLGIPFYGRGKKPFPGYLDCNKFSKYEDGTTLHWDEDAKVPYRLDKDGNLVLSFDDEKSIEEKCNFIEKKGLAGVFVWNYDSDYSDHRLAKKIHRCIKFLNDSINR